MFDEKQVLNLYDLDFNIIQNDDEVASAQDSDLMKIRCFACHEGVNENGTNFPRKALLSGYETFVDKPVYIVLENNLPTGHGYDFKKKKFNANKRKQVGHVTHADLYIVGVDEKMTRVTYWSPEEYPEGELRVVCDLVIYKKYMPDMADLLANLHIKNILKFSMESMVQSIEQEDGTKYCVSIHFTALTIVRNPAFKNSYSIDIAESEEDDMNYQELYEAEKARVETLVAEKTNLETVNASLVAEKETLANEVLDLKTNVAEVDGKLIEANAEIENLKPFKEKVELAEKIATIGAERAEKLSRFKVTKTAEELAEITKEEFVNVLEEAVNNYEPSFAEDTSRGAFMVDTKLKNKDANLMELLNKLK